jgi:sulfite oxidase
VPDIDPTAWRMRVHGAVERELELSLTTLHEAFQERAVTATLQCAGNRRAGLAAIREIPGEAPWGPGATGTATWTGVALADVLSLAGPLHSAKHVGFVGADVSPEAAPIQRFGGSIPLGKAFHPEVLLAWAMNGEPLPPVHGAPVRVVVPRPYRRAQRQVARGDRGPLGALAGVLPGRRLSTTARGRDAGPRRRNAPAPRRAQLRRRDASGRRHSSSSPLEVRGHAFAGGET